MALGDLGEAIFINFLLVLAMMIGAWVFYLIKRNGNIFDIAWSFGFIVTSIISFALCDGYIMRRLLIVLLVWLWSIRLCVLFFKRFQREEKEGRFQTLRKWFGANSSITFGILFILQAVVVVILSVPFILISSNQYSSFTSLEVFSLFVFLGGFCGEVLSDNQLQKFKDDPKNQDKVCNVGLWRCSRHPNYFFEFLIWVSFFLLSIEAPLGLIAVISPIIMWYLLHQMIKQNEEDSLLKKGVLYQEYQEKTSSFFPWFPM